MSKMTYATLRNIQPSSHPGANRNSDAVAALGALYQGEKTDASYVFSTAMAMMGLAVAYLVVAIPFVGDLNRGHTTPSSWLLLLIIPFPLWLVAAFQSLMTLNAMSHGISVRIIEDALFKASGLRVRRELVGSAASDEIMDVEKACFIHKVTSVVVYGGVCGVEILFTAYAIYSANSVINAPGHFVAPAVWMASGAYLLLLVMVGRSWLVGFEKIKQGRREIPRHPVS